LEVKLHGGSIGVKDWIRIVFIKEPVCCTEYPVADFNKDCRVDFADFAIFAQNWLKCNLIAG